MSSNTIACFVVEINGIFPITRAVDTWKIQPLEAVVPIFVVHINVCRKYLSSTENFNICPVHCVTTHTRLAEIFGTIAGIFAVVRTDVINVITHKLPDFQVTSFPTCDSHGQASEQTVSITFNSSDTWFPSAQFLSHLGVWNIGFAHNERYPVADCFPLCQDEREECEIFTRLFHFEYGYIAVTSLVPVGSDVWQFIDFHHLFQKVIFLNFLG